MVLVELKRRLAQRDAAHQRPAARSGHLRGAGERRRDVHPCGVRPVPPADPQASEGGESSTRCTTAARHPPLRTKAVEQLGADKLETQLGRGRINSWWLKRSKVQKREFRGAPLLAIKFLDGICSDCGLPCQYCRHGHVATVSFFLEKNNGNPLASFDAISARSPANARARIEEAMKREDTISQVACIVYSPP